MKTSAYIYVLADNLEGVFYVGQGQNNRIDLHEREAQKGCACEKCTKIRLIWGRGESVQKYKIYEGIDGIFRDIAALEKALIVAYGHVSLTNQVYATVPVDPTYHLIPKSVIIPFEIRKAIYPYIEKCLSEAGMEVNKDTVKEYLTEVSSCAILEKLQALRAFGVNIPNEVLKIEKDEE